MLKSAELQNGNAELVDLLMSDESDERDREIALEQLLEIRAEFLAEKDGQPIRLGHLASRLDVIEGLAARLATEIEAFRQEYDSSVGRSAGDLFTFDRRVEPLVDEFISPLSREEAEHARQVSLDANIVRGRLVDRFGTGDVDKPDRGGAALETARFGSPKSRLVRRLLFLWDYFSRPLSTTVGGDVDFYVDSAWRWIVPDIEPKSLNNEIRKAIGAVRLVRVLNERRHKLEVCADNMMRIGATTESERLRCRSMRILRGVERRYLI